MSHIFENREYLILPVSELTKVDFNLVLETSAETVRKSIDETKTFVKWEGSPPSFVAAISGAEGPYTYDEILNILTGVEWTATGII
jgi:hypothetical protein